MTQSETKKVTNIIPITNVTFAGVPCNTVLWNARGTLIQVNTKSAHRSATYVAYMTSPSRDCTIPFYIDWSPADVHALLDRLRDSVSPIGVNIYETSLTLASYLKIDIKYTPPEEKKLIDECTALLYSISKMVLEDPTKYSSTQHADERSVSAWFNCAPFIPKDIPIKLLMMCSHEIPLEDSLCKQLRASGIFQWHSWQWKREYHPNALALYLVSIPK